MITWSEQMRWTTSVDIVRMPPAMRPAWRGPPPFAADDDGGTGAGGAPSVRGRLVAAKSSKSMVGCL
eukprot:5149545-Prymnesium_polylepis.1